MREALQLISIPERQVILFSKFISILGGQVPTGSSFPAPVPSITHFRTHNSTLSYSAWPVQPRKNSTLSPVNSPAFRSIPRPQSALPIQFPSLPEGRSVPGAHCQLIASHCKPVIADRISLLHRREGIAGATPVPVNNKNHPFNNNELVALLSIQYNFLRRGRDK